MGLGCACPRAGWRIRTQRTIRSINQIGSTTKGPIENNHWDGRSACVNGQPRGAAVRRIGASRAGIEGSGTDWLVSKRFERRGRPDREGTAGSAECRPADRGCVDGTRRADRASAVQSDRPAPPRTRAQPRAAHVRPPVEGSASSAPTGGPRRAIGAVRSIVSSAEMIPRVIFLFPARTRAPFKSKFVGRLPPSFV